jgi:hypothetical protein
VAIWAEAQFTQSAIAWVLACVFVRFCEDNALLDAPLLVGTDARGQSAQARQEAFFMQNPTASDNDYLRDVFAVAARLPGLSDVMRVQRTLLEAPVSADLGKQLVRFFRAANADTGALVHDFADPDWNTRFLGDLYQDLSEAAREKYALLQTPEFVESFILDRTLTPALDIYALEDVDLIDPTCGSGHFLLGAFERLAPRWLRQMPGNVNVAIQEALSRIAGVDLNPYAVVIARFRLLIAALKMANVHKLRLAPSFICTLKLATVCCTDSINATTPAPRYRLDSTPRKKIWDGSRSFISARLCRRRSGRNELDLGTEICSGCWESTLHQCRRRSGISPLQGEVRELLQEVRFGGTLLRTILGFVPLSRPEPALRLCRPDRFEFVHEARIWQEACRRLLPENRFDACD